MYCVVGKPKQVSELKSLIHQPVGGLRGQVPIVVIDDEGFLYLEVLRNHGFQITVLRDLTDIKAVESYPVVVCDIKGVGKSLDSRYEGAHVISEIKKHYPTKILIAYTGQRFDATFNQYFALCDASIRKDAESQVWVDTLDQAISSHIDPIEQWKKIRQFLLLHDIPTLTLLGLENHYVRSLLKKRIPFQDDKQLIDLPPEVKSALISTASNLIVKLLTH
jgi:hypothetical protein